MRWRSGARPLAHRLEGVKRVPVRPVADGVHEEREAHLRGPWRHVGDPFGVRDQDAPVLRLSS